jgi:hypothetical protein
MSERRKDDPRETAEEDLLPQQNVGPGNELGGGEWPDPETPPSDVAGGSAGIVRSPEHGQGQFARALREEADQESGTET